MYSKTCLFLFLFIYSFFCLAAPQENKPTTRDLAALSLQTENFKATIVKKISSAATDSEAKEIFISYLKRMNEIMKKEASTPEMKRQHKLMVQMSTALENDNSWNSSKDNLLRICAKVDEVNKILKEGKLPEVVLNTDVHENGIIGGLIGGIAGVLLVGLPGSMVFWHLRETEDTCNIEQWDENCGHITAALVTFFGSIASGITGAIIGATMIPF